MSGETGLKRVSAKTGKAGNLRRSSVSRSSVILVRSLLFNALFYANLIIHLIVALPALVLPRPVLRVFIRSYSHTSLWLLRVVCGIGVTWRGTDKIPQGACIVASKHQSAWETFAFYAVLHDPVYILKRELMWIPLFGWYMRKAGLIPIDRSAGMAALARMTARARAALVGPHSRQLVIFPEGTRRAPGAAPDYKPGIVHLYSKTGVPCVPVALNSGLFWPRRSLRKFPGTIIVEVLDPIAPGLDKTAFFARLQDAIEQATARLIRESENRAPATGNAASANGSHGPGSHGPGSGPGS
jgi:1-acyl-sn-glycerol-3-phosphate acyltransferase